MRDARKIGLRASSCLVVLSGYLALSTTSRYSVGVVAIPVGLLALMPLGEWLDGRFARYRTATSFISLAYVVVSVALLPFVDLLANVVSLVIFIQVYAFLHRKKARDYVHLLLMSFFLVLAASVLMPDPEVGLAMLLFLICAIAQMTLMQIDGEMARAGPNGAADILPLREQELSLVETRRPFDLGVVYAIAAISATAVAITAGLFLAMPRMEAGLLGRSDPTLFRTGVSQTVDLAQGGRIDRTATALMRIEFPNEPEGQYNGPMFWRCASLDFYQDPQWQRRGLAAQDGLVRYALGPREILEAANRKSGLVRREPDRSRRLVRQSVYIQEAPAEGVPALTLVQRMATPEDVRGVVLTWDRTADYTVLLNRPGQRWLQYEAWSEVEAYSPEELRAAPDNYREVISERNYHLLTYQTLQPRTRDLVENITRGKTNTHDKVTAIATYLGQGGYRYTLDIPDLPMTQPIDAFLNDVRAGHCELYASAMALMVRSLGIPARVVAGYRGGEWSALDRTYTVREDMAHLWVEVYFIGVGWVTFDPSPPNDQLGTLGNNRLLRFLSRQALVAKMLWYRNVVAFNSGRQVALWSSARQGFLGLREGLFDWGSQRTSQFKAGPAFAALLVLLLVFAAATTGLVAWARRTNPYPYPLTADQARAVKLYRRLLRKCARTGMQCRGMTAEEVRTAMQEHEAPGFEVAGSIVGVYNEVRFGARPLSRDAYRRLAKRLKAKRS